MVLLVLPLLFPVGGWVIVGVQLPAQNPTALSGDHPTYHAHLPCLVQIRILGYLTENLHHHCQHQTPPAHVMAPGNAQDAS